MSEPPMSEPRISETEILEGIAAVAREHLAYDGPLDRETSLVEALRLDSIRLLTLVVEIENRFQVILEDGDEAGLQTVGDLVEVLSRALSPARPSGRPTP